VCCGVVLVGCVWWGVCVCVCVCVCVYVNPEDLPPKRSIHHCEHTHSTLPVFFFLYLSLSHSISLSHTSSLFPSLSHSIPLSLSPILSLSFVSRPGASFINTFTHTYLTLVSI